MKLSLEELATVIVLLGLFLLITYLIAGVIGYIAADVVRAMGAL
jgi:hypothetical protein